MVVVVMMMERVFFFFGGGVEEVRLSSGRASGAPVVPAKTEEEVRLSQLPHTYFDIEIAGVPKGRIVFALYNDVSHLAAENFRALCTGEKGVVPEGKEGAGQTYWFKGRSFYRIIDQFIDQTGAGTESIYGGKFKDDPGGLKLKHTRSGLLSMANYGPDTNTSHFSILMAPAPHLDGHYVVFGEVVRGMDIAREINSHAKGKKDNTAGAEVQAKIVDAGMCSTPECL
ncbi:cyclophilin-type peptidyl-prolyl cis-trans isomerase [Chloropicon primus]|uniref:Peptidyl-prolyl cis-trans isomerase n=1 Tax=Chloropicon primus TaxID=1764295 RepID=A0A5B8MED2_9CHLO|nr:cyclophilin-type peptidyl-prolyl cis-trans isomerase [Chloropicon primus]|eukprot:QDZ18966.1 cyclophilin-type peptidyl-prolyl cis-trans isomerase [Chloropicon primus]